MLALIKPLVLTSLKSDKFKKFVVELLEKLVESTDNDLDDRALQIVKKGFRYRIIEGTNIPRQNFKPLTGDSEGAFLQNYMKTELEGI